MKSVNLNFLQPSGPLQACKETAFLTWWSSLLLRYEALEWAEWELMMIGVEISMHDCCRELECSAMNGIRNTSCGSNSDPFFRGPQIFQEIYEPPLNSWRQVGDMKPTPCSQLWSGVLNPYPTAFPYGNGMVLHFYQQQESSTTKTVHKVINKGLKTYV